MRTRVTIGDFSRASQLSVKTLRHYHEVGLLDPSEVDPDSGYRYYSEDQIPLAQVIRRLRGLQMPVADVKSVLAATDSEERNRLIVEHLDRLELELAHTREAVGELRDLLLPEAPHPIEHRTVEPTPAIGIEQTVDRDDIFDWWQGALGELHVTLRAQSLTASGPTGGLYASEIFQHSRGQATVFIPTDGIVKPDRTGRLTADPRRRARGHPAPRPPQRYRPYLRKTRRLRDQARNQRRWPATRELPTRHHRDRQLRRMGHRDRLADLPDPRLTGPRSQARSTSG